MAVTSKTAQKGAYNRARLRQLFQVDEQGLRDMIETGKLPRPDYAALSNGPNASRWHRRTIEPYLVRFLQGRTSS